jgi:hypothetical protein
VNKIKVDMNELSHCLVLSSKQVTLLKVINIKNNNKTSTRNYANELNNIKKCSSFSLFLFTAVVDCLLVVVRSTNAEA